MWKQQLKNKNLEFVLQFDKSYSTPQFAGNKLDNYHNTTK